MVAAFLKICLQIIVAALFDSSALHCISDITGITSDSCSTQLFLHLYRWKTACGQIRSQMFTCNSSIWLVFFWTFSPSVWSTKRHLTAL